MRSNALSSWLFVVSIFSNLLGLALPLALLQVYDRILPTAQYGTAVSLLVAVAIATVFDGFLRFVRVRTAARTSVMREHRQTVELASALLSANPAQLLKIESGVRRAGFDDITQARDLGGVATQLPLFDVPFAFIFIALMWFIGGWLALVPLVVLAAFSAIALRTARLQRDSATARANDGQMMMSRLAKRALFSAMLTPVEKMGSTNRAASPTITKRSPQIWVMA